MTPHEAEYRLRIIGGPEGEPNVAECLKADGMGYSPVMQELVGKEGCRRIIQRWYAEMLADILSGKLVDRDALREAARNGTLLRTRLFTAPAVDTGQGFNGA